MINVFGVSILAEKLYLQGLWEKKAWCSFPEI
jgi:hypothetical protein